ncbi:MAG: 6-carboxytetrahydropterin synthase [Oleispira antarctica]|nr:6-carboxytetrahydropterin synthase [Oleispira antarctica]MBQ0793773.1 6-carboxytetrahydropterin synthase [Oleispira antarctica]|tara:strand:+ start:436 stop:1281 length:846 start_codon:yes stop_codon:yes gene_type:complete
MQLFVDNLTNVDFSYLDDERGLVGETWLASVLLDGGLDQTSMIWDFGVVKKVLRNWLDDELDHRLLVPTKSQRLSYEINQDRITLSWSFGNDNVLTMDAPLEAVALIDAKQINEQTAAKWSIKQLSSHFPDNLEHIQLTFEAEEINAAYYHYSHGLKKHDGNCQRIAHGHRSRIQIWCDGARDRNLENNWAERWSDIYIGSEEDLISISDNEQAQMHFAYDAPQGHFELTLPKKVCYIMPSDTTVECIASHIAQILHDENPDSTITVKAFEGLNKGAIFEV